MVSSIECLETAQELIDNCSKRGKNKSKMTRQNLWDIICKEYPAMKNFRIEANFNGNPYISRPTLIELFMEMNLHKSNHLTPLQKEKFHIEIANLI